MDVGLAIRMPSFVPPSGARMRDDSGQLFASLLASVTKQYIIYSAQSAVMLYGWEGNRRKCVTQQWFNHQPAEDLRKREVHPQWAQQLFDAFGLLSCQILRALP